MKRFILLDTFFSLVSREKLIFSVRKGVKECKGEKNSLDTRKIKADTRIIIARCQGVKEKCYTLHFTINKKMLSELLHIPLIWYFPILFYF